MSEIQYDPACVECRRDAGRPLAGTSWECAGHVSRDRKRLTEEVAALREALRHSARELSYILDSDPCEDADVHQTGEGRECVALAEKLLGPMREWPEELNLTMARASRPVLPGNGEERRFVSGRQILDTYVAGYKTEREQAIPSDGAYDEDDERRGLAAIEDARKREEARRGE